VNSGCQRRGCCCTKQGETGVSHLSVNSVEQVEDHADAEVCRHRSVDPPEAVHFARSALCWRCVLAAVALPCTAFTSEGRKLAAVSAEALAESARSNQSAFGGGVIPEKGQNKWMPATNYWMTRPLMAGLAKAKLTCNYARPCSFNEAAQ
jgi:hypothetical protein